MGSSDRSTGAAILLVHPERDAPPSESRLRAAAARALAHAGALGHADAPDPLPSATEELLDLIDEAGCRVAGTLAAGPPRARVAELSELLVVLRDLRGDLGQLRLTVRMRALARINVALEELRSAPSPSELLERLPRAVCDSCGFARCVIARISGSDWIVEGAHFSGEPAAAEEYLTAVGGRRVRLDRTEPESDIVRRRTAVTVRRAAGDDRPVPEFVPPGTTASIGVPLVASDRVIGVLHADHGPHGRDVEQLDELVLAAFADGVDDVYDHTLLAHRLATQHDHVRRMVASTGALLDDLAQTDIVLAGATSNRDLGADGAASMFAAPPTDLEALLTRRELEVLELMAAGDSNAVMAGKLFIAEGTVKSHVKHILRKLRAANRAEAIARYLNGFLTSAGR